MLHRYIIDDIKVFKQIIVFIVKEKYNILNLDFNLDIFYKQHSYRLSVMKNPSKYYLYFGEHRTFDTELCWLLNYTEYYCFNLYKRKLEYIVDKIMKVVRENVF